MTSTVQCTPPSREQCEQCDECPSLCVSSLTSDRMGREEIEIVYFDQSTDNITKIYSVVTDSLRFLKIASMRASTSTITALIISHQLWKTAGCAGNENAEVDVWSNKDRQNKKQEFRHSLTHGKTVCPSNVPTKSPGSAYNYDQNFKYDI